MAAVWQYVVTVACIILSGTFSGLTLGLMSLDVIDLRVLAESGTDREQWYAKRIMPVRKHGNFLLCSLLIGNTAVNSALSIVTADIFGGIWGFIAATMIILYIGEIVPQSICHRYGLVIGAHAIPLVKLFMFLTGVLSYPTSLVLDYFLGGEPATRYNKSQLRSLLSLHGISPGPQPGPPGDKDDADDAIPETSEYVLHRKSDKPATPQVHGVSDFARGQSGPTEGDDAKRATPAIPTSALSTPGDTAEHTVLDLTVDDIDVAKQDVNDRANSNHGTAHRKLGRRWFWLSQKSRRSRRSAGGATSTVGGNFDNEAGADAAELRSVGDSAGTGVGSVADADGGSGADKDPVFIDGTGGGDDGDSSRHNGARGRGRRDREREKDRDQNGRGEKEKERRKDKKDDHQPPPLTAEEMTLLNGAFMFSQKTVDKVMTPLDDCFMLDSEVHLDFNTLLEIFKSGHSRIPVYEKTMDRIIGVMFAKDLILLDPDDALPIRVVLAVFERTLLIVSHLTPLDEMLNIFKKGGGHLALVQHVHNEGTAEQDYETLGVCTLEDLIEELIGQDIVDETDVFTDNVNRRRVRRMRLLDPEMIRMFDDKSKSDERLSDKEVKVVAAYLAASFEAFSRDRISEAVLLQLIGEAGIVEYSEQSHADGLGSREEDSSALPTESANRSTDNMGNSIDGLPNLDETRDDSTDVFQNAAENASEGTHACESEFTKGFLKKVGGRLHTAEDGSSHVREKSPPNEVLYKRGVVTQDAYLVISGRVEITAGDEGFLSEAGPWTLLANRALTDDVYAPDFSARVVERPARLLRIRKRLYRRMLRFSAPDGARPRSMRQLASIELSRPPAGDDFPADQSSTSHLPGSS